MIQRGVGGMRRKPGKFWLHDGFILEQHLHIVGTSWKTLKLSSRLHGSMIFTIRGRPKNHTFQGSVGVDVASHYCLAF